MLELLGRYSLAAFDWMMVGWRAIVTALSKGVGMNAGGWVWGRVVDIVV